MRKTILRFYTIADYEDEELWLREQHKAGWKLVSVSSFLYVFESCQPEDVIYRLDYKNSEQTEEYMQMLQDFGWEYFEHCFGWLYFRKPAADISSEEEGELFSDPESRIDMVNRIVQTRMLPIAVIFLCCVLPNLIQALNGNLSVYSGFFGGFFGVMFVLYMYIIIHSGIKLKKIRDRYRK